MQNGKIAAGFYAQHSHQVVTAPDCLLGPPEQHWVLLKAVEPMERYSIPPYEEENGRGLVRHILIREAFADGSMHVCFVINGKKIPHAREIAAELMKSEYGRGHARVTGVSACVNETRGNRILGEKLIVIAGEEKIEETIGHCRYRISPLSFFQVNPLQTRKLYDLVKEYAGLTGKETVYDLYCGAGTIGQYLAEGAEKIIGIEIVPQAVMNAKENAVLNGIGNAEYYAGPAEELLPKLLDPKEDGGGTVAVVDPPRKGCDRILLDTLIKLGPEKIVYVSCDPATLARDLRILADGGYMVEKARPVECFGMSVHVECVVSMLRKNT